MARRPDVFVRPLADAEQQRLVAITRRAREPVRLRRAMIVQMSAQGRSVATIAELTAFSQRYIREVIHAFNEQGFEALDPNGAGVGPRRSMTAPGGRSAASRSADPPTSTCHLPPGVWPSCVTT